MADISTVSRILIFHTISPASFFHNVSLGSNHDLCLQNGRDFVADLKVFASKMIVCRYKHAGQCLPHRPGSSVGLFLSSVFILAHLVKSLSCPREYAFSFTALKLFYDCMSFLAVNSSYRLPPQFVIMAVISCVMT